MPNLETLEITGETKGIAEHLESIFLNCKKLRVADVFLTSYPDNALIAALKSPTLVKLSGSFSLMRELSPFLPNATVST